jgi:hypothetical protein
MTWYLKKGDIQKKRDTTRLDAVRADENIFYCEKCNRCWQIDWENTRTTYNRERNIILYAHYNDFPKYKRERKECNMCENKKYHNKTGEKK